MESVIIKEEVLVNASTLAGAPGGGTPGGNKGFGGPTSGGGGAGGRKGSEAAEAAERRARVNTEVWSRLRRVRANFV